MNPMMGRQPPPEKGDRMALWRLLEVDFSETQIVWQDYNPYPKLSHLPQEFVFVDTGCGTDEPFNDSSAVTSGLQHMLFPFAGSIDKLTVSRHKFTPLVRTGDRTGTVASDEVFQPSFFGMGGQINEARRQYPTDKPYVLAAQIQGSVQLDSSSDTGGDGADGDGGSGNGADDGSDDSSDSEKSEKKAGPKESDINVVLVADIDMLHREFFRLREQGSIPEAGIRFDFDNVTFVLNVLDSLAGDDRFLTIRKRRPAHRTLTRIEAGTEEARRDTAETIEKLRDEYQETEEAEDKTVKDKVDKLRERLEKQNIPSQEVLIRVAMAEQDANRRKQTKLEQLEQKRDREINRIETETALKIRKLQDTYKLWAVLLPPIPPLLVALIVFFTRRMREREGVARSRLRS
jgi:ABC-2 type transport system permease protein